MRYTGIKYAAFNKDHNNIVRESKSSIFYCMRISKAEWVKRLHLADDIFYADGEIKELIIKKVDGTKEIIPGACYVESKNKRR